jgi:hypothetical protein
VVVAALDVVSVAIHEVEADAPLSVDGQGVLAFAVTDEGVQAISSRNSQRVHADHPVDQVQLPDRTNRNVWWYTRCPASGEEFPRALVSKALDRDCNVSRDA